MRKGNRKRREMSRFRRLHTKLYMGMFTSHVPENKKVCKWKLLRHQELSQSHLFLPRALLGKNQPLFHWGACRTGLLSYGTLGLRMSKISSSSRFFQCLPLRLGLSPLPHALTVNYRSHCNETQNTCRFIFQPQGMFALVSKLL